MKKFKLDWLILPLVGVTFILGIWAISSATWAKDLPSPLKTWESSRPYIVEPFAKRGEMDQGILRFTWYSLVLVAQGYALALIIGTPVGFLLGLSKGFTKTFDPSDHVVVRSRRGEAEAVAFVTATVQPGQLFMPMHFATSPRTSIAGRAT